LDYQDVDVTKDRKALDEMVKVSGQMGVPVLSIDGKIVVGFEQSRIDEMIKNQA
jgi:glutaredoxin